MNIKLEQLKRMTPTARWTFSPDLSLYYHIISPPQADNESLSEAGDRLVLVHGSPSLPETRIVIAPKGQIFGGWVIGLIA